MRHLSVKVVRLQGIGYPIQVVTLIPVLPEDSGFSGSLMGFNQSIDCK